MAKSTLEGFQAWLETSGTAPKAATTVARYVSYAEQFVADVGHPKRVSTAQLAAWQTALRGSLSAVASQNVRVAAVRTLFRWAVESKQRPADAAASLLKMRRIAKRKPQFVDRQQLLVLFEFMGTLPPTPEVLQDVALLESLYGSGLRRSEAGALTLGQFVGRSQLRVVGKGNKERLTLVTSKQLDAVAAWAVVRFATPESQSLHAEVGPEAAFEYIRRHHADAGLFISGDRRPVRDLRDPGHWVAERVQRCTTASGIGKVRAHQMRHSFATHLIGSGQVQLTEVQSMLGHEDIETTTCYVGLEGQSFERARIAHPRG